MEERLIRMLFSWFGYFFVQTGFDTQQLLLSMMANNILLLFLCSGFRWIPIGHPARANRV